MGAVLVDTSPEGWRVYFYVDSALLGTSAIVCALFYNPPPTPFQNSLSQREKLERLDWTGSALLALGFILFSMALTWINNPYPPDDVHCLAPMILGILLIIALVIHQAAFKKDGLFHYHLFRNRNFAISSICIFGEGMTFFAPNSYYTFECSILYDTSTIRLGLRYSIFFVMTGISALSVAYYCFRMKAIRGPMVLAFVTFTVFHGGFIIP